MPEVWPRLAQNPESKRTVSRAIEEERFRGGHGDMTPLATALLKASRAAASPESAANLLFLAAEAAPGDPRPRAALVRLAAFELRSPGLALRQLVALVTATVADPWVQATVLLRSAAILWLGAGVAAVSLLILGAGLHGRSALHDYVDAFPSGVRAITPWAFGLLLIVALGSFGVGPAVVLMLLGLLLGPYFRTRARWALGLCLLLLALIFPLMSLLSGLAGSNGQRAWALYRVAQGGSGRDLEADLTRLFSPREPKAFVARAYLARRAGKFQGASELLESALGLGADEASTRLELGNVFFIRGLLGDAVEQFRRVTVLRPKDATAWINLHVLYLRQLELVEADRSLATARALDAGAVERFHSGELGGAESLLTLSNPIPASWIRSELLSGAGWISTWAEHLSAGLFLSVSQVRPLYLGLATLAALWAAARKGAGRRSRRCASCGEVVCPRCSRRVKDSPLCSGCWTLANQRGGDSSERAKQSRAGERWQRSFRRWRRLTAAVVPGWSGFVLEGGRAVDLGVGILWALGGGAVLLALLYPVPVLPWSAGGLPVVPVAVLLAAHGWGIRRAAAARGLRRR